MGTQRTPEDIWSALEKEALEGDDAERAGAMSVEDAVKELAEAGVDAEKVKAEARAFRTELDRNIAGREQAAEAAARARARRLRAPRRAALFVGLAAALVVCVAAAYAAWVRGHPKLHAPALPASKSAPSAPPPAPSSELIAPELRRQAFEACDAKRWPKCLSLLQQARDVDPAGDGDRRVQSARREAMEHLDEKGADQWPAGKEK
jgi:hypothetical protein